MDKPRFRHELKYQVSLGEAERFFEDVMPYCEYDKHADETHSYEIASTYYDSPELRFYVDREESVGYRRKIRLRSYNNDGKAVALFVEIKEKHKQFVSKKRINMKDQSILEMGIPHNKIPLPLVIEHLEDSPEKREMEYLGNRLNLQPVVIVRYVRQALIPTFENDMRITLDTRISGGGEDLPVYDPSKEKLVLGADQGVLEIKSNHGIPLWLNSALSRSSFVQPRYSNYALAVEAVYVPNKPWLRFNAESNQDGENHSTDPVRATA